MSQSTSLDAGRHSPLRELGDQLRHLWWIPLLTGLVSIGLGLAILAADWTVHALVIITGLVFIIRGIALAFSPAYAGRTSGEQVAAGIAGVIAGVVLVAWPGPSLLVLAFFVGAWLGVSGSFHIVTSVSRRRELPHWGFTFSAGVIELLLGIWAMRRPEATLALLITIIGLWAVVTGVIYCALAIEIRSTARYCRSASAPANALPADVVLLLCGIFGSAGDIERTVLAAPGLCSAGHRHLDPAPPATGPDTTGAGMVHRRRLRRAGFRRPRHRPAIRRRGEPAAPCSIGSTARPAAVHLPGLSRPRSVGQDRRKERGLDGHRVCSRRAWAAAVPVPRRQPA